MGLKKEVIRFSIVTPLVGITDWGVYYLSLQVLPFSVSKGISFVCGGLVGYLLNKHWTFSQRERSYSEMGRYWVAQLIMLGFNVSSNQILLHFWPKAVFVCLVIASISTAVLSFILKKWWVFRHRGVSRDRYLQSH